MDITKGSKKGDFIDVRSKRLNNKEEISRLKAELENLISTGIQLHEHRDVLPKPAIVKPQPPIIKSYEVANQSLKIDKSILKKPKDSKLQENNKEEKKEKGYDVEATREYMRKQKEKRLEKQKMEKKTEVVLDRKQKLKQLQERTRKIVEKNAVKARAKSKERTATQSEEAPKVESLKEEKQIELTSPKPIVEKVSPKVSLLQNITVRESVEAQNKPESISAPSPLLLEPPKCITEPRCRWLQEPVTSHPFNFINTVRRKLEYHVNSPKPKTFVDIGIQNSFVSHKCQPQNNQKKQSQHSFLSHLNLNPEALENYELVKKSLSSESEDTSKNIPDLSLESISKHSKSTGASLKPTSIAESYASDFNVSETNSQSSIRTILSAEKTAKKSSESVQKTIEASKTLQSDLNTSIEILNGLASATEHIEEVLPLKPPSVSLNINNFDKEKSVGKSSEIHLKFEAEIHLLNDFNQSLRNLTAVEKAFDAIKSKQETNEVKKSSCSSISTINYSRGSEASFNLDFSSDFNQTNNSNLTLNETNLELTNVDNIDVNNVASISLKVLEQMIKNEDSRLDNLKTILKIREQVLRDRVKSELAVLEIQRRALRETGKLEEASALKRKQRGILIKHSQEKHEMQRLQQMQKAKAKERIEQLKEQRNLIKSQLINNDSLMGKIKGSSRKLRRQSSGPLKVLQSQTESILEASISKDNLSVVSVKSNSISFVKQEENRKPKQKRTAVAEARRALLLREEALQRRKKEAEEILVWHRKLLEEERKVAELESAARAISQSALKESSESHKTSSKVDTDSENKSSSTVNTEIEKSVIELDQSKVDLKESTYASDFEEEVQNNTEKAALDSTISEKDSVVIIESDHEELENLKDSVIEIVEINEEVPTKASTVSSESGVQKSDSNSKFPDIVMSTSIKESSSRKEETVLTGKSLVEEEQELEGSENLEEEESEKETDIDEDLPTDKSVKLESSKRISEEIMSPNSAEMSLAKDAIPELIQSLSSVEEILNNSLAAFKNASDDLDKLSRSSKIDELESEIEKEELSYGIVDSKPETDSSMLNKEIYSVEEKEEESLASESQEESNFVKTELNEKTEKDSSNKELLTEKDSTNKELLTEKDSSIKELLTEKGTVSSVDECILESSKLVEEEESYTKEFESETSEQIVEENSESSKSESSSKNKIDIKKRVSEILSQNSKSPNSSPRMQDLYITTYDVPLESTDCGRAFEDSKSPKKPLDNEVEELLKKQLAIEQEIIQLKQQQQKQVPYVLVREIPNKPPPPYTPPSNTPKPAPISVLPATAEQLNEITQYSAKIIHKAYLSKNLENVSISENTLSLIDKKNIGKDCYKFAFDLCKELAVKHYKQFDEEACPSWMLNKKLKLASVKPLDCLGLERFLNTKLKEVFGFVKPNIRENAIIKWSRKKRDHVDEILVMESQAEESEWTTYDKDELAVIDQVIGEIMSDLLKENIEVFVSIQKRM